MSFFRRIFPRLLRILAGVPIVSLLLVGLLFLILGATLEGRSVGLSAALLAGILYCSVGYWNRKWFKRIQGRFYAALLPLSLLLYLVPMILVPGDGETEDGRVRSCFLHGQERSSRYSPWNVIPESDQFKVGSSILPFIDPYVDSAKARRIRSLVLPIYEAMEDDAEFSELGTAMGGTHREILRLEFRTGHYFLFLPETTSDERLPCLIFLHGMGGNIKPYLWVLSRMSARMKCAVIAPTFGLGYWGRAVGAKFVVDVAKEALAAFPLDPERLFLLGYSNGAMGVTRAAIKEPGLFKGLIYLSPVTEDELFSSPDFLTHDRGRRVLFLHGGCDKRIPRTFVEGTVRSLRQLGGDVRLKIYDDEDHYLLFSQPESVLSDIVECMKSG